MRHKLYFLCFVLDVQGDSDTQESESILPDDGPGEFVHLSLTHVADSFNGLALLVVGSSLT